MTDAAHRPPPAETSSPRVFASVDDLAAAVGQHLGHSSWHLVDQAAIDAFAAVTGDHQWIHVDPERAADGPFGTTIAHGYLTLSLISVFFEEILRIGGVSTVINYGCNRVRFPAVLPVGSRVRGGAEVLGLTEHGGGHQLVLRVTVERDGGDRPVCVAETVSYLVP